MKKRISLNKNNTLVIKVIGIASVVALITLAAGLPNIDFQQGRAITIQEKGWVFRPIQINFYPTLLASICLSSMLLSVPALIILLIFSSEARKLFKKYFRIVVLWLVIIVGLRFYALFSSGDEVIYELSSSPPATPEVFNPLSLGGAETEDMAEYTPPEVSSWLGFVIGFTSILLIGVISYLFWEKHRSREDDLGTITLKAIRDISSGKQWEDAVIECYAKMSAAVSHRRQLDRELAMTPSEFSRMLVSTGLPSGPVIELTHLFERARYSNRGSQTTEAQRALRCLNAINQALGGEN